MYVYYDWLTECWTKYNSDGKEEVLTDMTPESIDDIEQEFESEEEFWDWYNSK